MKFAIRISLVVAAMIIVTPVSAQTKQDVGKLLKSVEPTLKQTMSLVDIHSELPEDSRIPLRLDKQSNNAEMNKLLDKAIEVLEVSSVSDLRDRVKLNHKKTNDIHNEIAEFRQKRLAAPASNSRSRLERVNPFANTKESIDKKIAALQEEIQELEAEDEKLSSKFKKELNSIGIDIDAEGVDSLLGSISGEDFVDMVVGFENIKSLTQQLQKLSAESGEAPDVAKQYYGMYVVLVQAVDRMQKSFVDRVENVHIPKLMAFASQAEQNIQQARALITSKSGIRKELLNNVDANEVTKKAAELYADYLREQAKDVGEENKAAEKAVNTALNTYMTVKLSSDVASLIQSGRGEFDSLMKLSVPPMKGFENQKLRNELKLITRELMR
jgi:uncharacterized small protein (DUF1192 family)